MTDKVKPRYMTWYEEAFQAEPAVRHMKPTARHFYRALLIQAFYCSTRPYLPDDDSQLWMLADAESEEQWLEHAKAVKKMFTPVEVEGVKLLSQKRLLHEWDVLVAQLSGKGYGGGRVGGGSHPRGTPPDNRTDQTRTEPTVTDLSLPHHRITETTSSNPNQNPNGTDQAGAGSGIGLQVDEEVSQSKTKTEPPEGSGKPVTTKVAVVAEEEDGTARGVKSEDLVTRFWLIAKKKPNDGEFCGTRNWDADQEQMRIIVRDHGIEKVKQALDHLSRSDFWGCQTKGKLDGIKGFGKALEAICVQAQKYLDKAKETAKAARQ